MGNDLHFIFNTNYLQTILINIDGNINIHVEN